jgi:hypothetical protein
VWPPTGEIFTSVTTILGTLNKPYLTKWAAKLAAEYAVSNWGDLTQMLIEGQVDEATRLMKEAHSESAQASSDIGTLVHACVEDHIKGKPNEILPVQFGFFKTWEEAYKPKYLLCESTVYNRTEGYAGTMDILAEVEGRNIIIDVKTGKSVYPEAALQLCAYSHGEWYDSGEGKYEDRLPQIDGAAVLHLRPRGFKYIPVRIDNEVWQAFRYVKEAYRWQRFTSKHVLGYDSPVMVSDW